MKMPPASLRLVLPRLLLKTHVDAYTRRDGVFVAAHEDKRSSHSVVEKNVGGHRSWDVLHDGKVVGNYEASIAKKKVLDHHFSRVDADAQKKAAASERAKAGAAARKESAAHKLDLDAAMKQHGDVISAAHHNRRLNFKPMSRAQFEAPAGIDLHRSGSYGAKKGSGYRLVMVDGKPAYARDADHWGEFHTTERGVWDKPRLAEGDAWNERDGSWEKRHEWNLEGHEPTGWGGKDRKYGYVHLDDLKRLHAERESAPIKKAFDGGAKILLLKSGPGTGARIAHSGRHALYGNPPRWHLVTHDNPAPKGAPIAHDPHAHAVIPAQHLTADEWSKLKLPDSNTNAATFNGALDKIKEWAEAGNVAALLGVGLGTNTYAKKLAHVINHVLAAYGSTHKVAPGQKAGDHAAVQATPVKAGPAAPSDHAAKAAHHAEMKQKHFDAAANATQASSHAAAKAHTEAAHAHKHAEWMNANHATTKGDVGSASSTADALSKEANQTKWKSGADPVSVAAVKPDDTKPTGPAPLHVFPGQGGTTVSVFKLTTGKFSVALKDNDSGETAQSMVHYPTEEWALSAAKNVAAGKPAGPNPATAPAPSYKVIDGGVGGLGKEGVLHKLSLSDYGAAESALGLPPGSLSDNNSTTYTISGADGKTFSVYKHGGTLSVRTSGDNSDAGSAEDLASWLQAKADDGPKEGDTKPGADGGTLVLKNGRWVKQSAPAAPGSLSAQHLQNLQSIPWFKQKLPDANSNAKSHNAAVAKIEAMAFAGDKAGLQAFVDAKAGAKQTYAKKQALLALTALAALQGDALAAEPSLAGKPAHDHIAHSMKAGGGGLSAADKWLAANPGAWDELNEALTANGFGHFADYGPKDAAAKKPPPVLEQLQAMGADKASKKAATTKAVEALGLGVQDNPHKGLLLAPNKGGMAKAYGAKGVAGSAAKYLIDAGIDASVTGSESPFYVKVHGVMSGGVVALKDHDPVAGWKAAVSAGKVPTKAQADAYEDLAESDPDAAQDAFMDAVNSLIPGETFNDDAFDDALQAAHQKAHELHGLGLADGLTDSLKLALGSMTQEGLQAILSSDVSQELKDYAGHKLAHFGKIKVDAPLYENTTGGHNKFWAVSVHGDTMKTSFGKIGHKAKAYHKTFPTAQAAADAAVKLMDEKKAKGYTYKGSVQHEYGGTPAVEQGPKEGDTKRGADGMLVLKNGHWVKVDKDADGGWSFSPNDKGFSGASTLASDDGLIAFVPGEGAEYHNEDSMESGAALHADSVAALVQQMIAAGHPVPPVAALQKLDPSYGKPKALTPLEVDEIESSHSDANTKILKQGILAALAGDHNALQTLKNDLKHHPKPMTKTKAAVQALLDAVMANVPATPGGAGPASTPAESPSAGVESIDGWTKHAGTQGGYTDGAFYTDPSGQQWYCKFHGAGAEGAHAEVLALKLYEAAGCAAPEMKLIKHGGKVGTASKIIDGLKQDKAALQAGNAHAIMSGFAADAWLANWDTVGNNPAAGKGWDNIQFGPDGKAYRIDAGGALQFKGTGKKKSASEWGDDVVETKSLLDPSINPNTAKAFGKITEADISASVAKVLSVPDWKIQDLVNEFGFGSAADKQSMVSKLVKRKQSLANQHPAAAKKSEKAGAKNPEKVKPDPAALKVDASLLPKPHDFMNWQNTGKPVSDKPYVQQNVIDEKAILDFAMNGNLVALKDYRFQPVDKLTGEASGEPVPVDQHPSMYVKSFYDSCVNFLEVLANPPEPLRTFDGKDADTVAELADHFKPFDYGKGVGDVPANQRLGFWIALGHASSPHKFKPAHVGKSITEAAKKKAFAIFGKLPKTVRTFIKSVQGSGSANQPYRDGKAVDNSGQDTRQVVADLYANSGEHTEGFTIHKWMDMPDSMIQQILSEPEGLVFQNPGSMCTSRSPTSTSGFGHHRMVIHYAKGAKGVDTFGSGGFSSEQEITTIPGVRFMVLSRKMVNDHLKSNPRMELEVLMLPPDPTYIANLNRAAQVAAV